MKGGSVDVENNQSAQRASVRHRRQTFQEILVMHGSQQHKNNENEIDHANTTIWTGDITSLLPNRDHTIPPNTTTPPATKKSPEILGLPS